MPLLAPRRVAVGCLVALLVAASAGPVWAQAKSKQTPKTNAAAKAAQPTPPAQPDPPPPPSAAPRSVHYAWVPEQIQERVSPFVVDVVLGMAGAGALALLLLVSTWIPPARRKSDDPLAGVPGQHRRKLQMLSEGETIVWASAGSDRVRRRNAGAAAWVGFSLFALALAAAVHHNWDGVEIALAAVAGCAAPCAVIMAMQPRYLFMLTDERAYVLRLGSDRHKAFIYAVTDLAPAEVLRASLVPRAGTVNFARARVVYEVKAKEAVAMGLPAPDPGPCGFLDIDNPSYVRDLIQQVTGAAAAPAPPPPPPADCPYW